MSGLTTFSSWESFLITLHLQCVCGGGVGGGGVCSQPRLVVDGPGFLTLLSKQKQNNTDVMAELQQCDSKLVFISPGRKPAWEWEIS